MRKHLKSHSFKDARFKCEDCEFVGDSKETMELHIQWTHTDTFECGICENTFGNGKTLETHRRTCAHILQKHNKEIKKL